MRRNAPIWAHGCLLGSMSMEVANLHPTLHRRIDELFDEFEDGLAAVFAPARKARNVSGITGKDLGRHMLAVIEGATITANSHRPPRLLANSLRHFRRYVEMRLKVEQ